MGLIMNFRENLKKIRSPTFLKKNQKENKTKNNTRPRASKPKIHLANTNSRKPLIIAQA